MAFITIGSGDDLIIEIPVKRTVDWADKLRDDCFQRIVEHDHSGSGQGRPIAGAGIASNGVDGSKILLKNNEWLRSAGATPGDPDQNILRVNPTGDLEIAPQKLVMSNGVILNNNGAFASRLEGELTVSGDLHLESNLLGPNLIQTSGNGIVSTKNVHLDPSDADPVGPMDGQLQYSDGTHRAAGLWQYMLNTWVQIKRNFISEPISDLEIKLQNDGWLKARNSTDDADINIVRVNASDQIEFGSTVTAVPGINSVGTPELQDGAVTTDKISNDSITKDKLQWNTSGIDMWSNSVPLDGNTIYQVDPRKTTSPYHCTSSTDSTSIINFHNISGRVIVSNNTGTTKTLSVSSPYLNVGTVTTTISPGTYIEITGVYVGSSDGYVMIGPEITPSAIYT